MAHAMKSAAFNVGEAELSALAGKLEKAGNENDMQFISQHNDAFLTQLEAAIRPSQSETTDDSDITEDHAFLVEQLQIIKTACENYNADAIYSAVNLLKERSWKNETLVAIEEIREKIFLESDFDEASALAAQLFKNHNE
jgi:HPt (histidine-containing phosphotransfer) domain-containing protein